MMTIWKFPLKIADQQFLRVPSGSKAISAQSQGRDVYLWATVDTDKANMGVDVSVWIHGTGHCADMAVRYGRHLSTVQIDEGVLIFHVFVGKDF